MIIPLVLWLVSNIHAAPMTNPCPIGLTPEERTLVVYVPNDTPKSKEHILQHFKFIVTALKTKKILHATALYQESNLDHGIFLYVISSQVEAKRIVELDPLANKNLFKITYEQLTECK